MDIGIKVDNEVFISENNQIVQLLNKIILNSNSNKICVIAPFDNNFLYAYFNFISIKRSLTQEKIKNSFPKQGDNFYVQPFKNEIFEFISYDPVIIESKKRYMINFHLNKKPFRQLFEDKKRIIKTSRTDNYKSKTSPSFLRNTKDKQDNIEKFFSSINDLPNLSDINKTNILSINSGHKNQYLEYLKKTDIYHDVKKIKLNELPVSYFKNNRVDEETHITTIENIEIENYTNTMYSTRIKMIPDDIKSALIMTNNSKELTSNSQYIDKLSENNKIILFLNPTKVNDIHYTDLKNYKKYVLGNDDVSNNLLTKCDDKFTQLLRNNINNLKNFKFIDFKVNEIGLDNLINKFYEIRLIKPVDEQHQDFQGRLNQLFLRILQSIGVLEYEKKIQYISDTNDLIEDLPNVNISNNSNLYLNLFEDMLKYLKTTKIFSPNKIEEINKIIQLNLNNEKKIFIVINESDLLKKLKQNSQSNVIFFNTKEFIKHLSICDYLDEVYITTRFFSQQIAKVIFSHKIKKLIFIGNIFEIKFYSDTLKKNVWHQISQLDSSNDEKLKYFSVKAVNEIILNELVTEEKMRIASIDDHYLIKPNIPLNNKEETVLTYYSSLECGGYVYLNKNKTWDVINNLIEGVAPVAQKKETKDLEYGDKIILRQTGDPEAYKEEAIRIQPDYDSLLLQARLWKKILLKKFSDGQGIDTDHIFSKLKTWGLNKNRITISNWLFDKYFISPENIEDIKAINEICDSPLSNEQVNTCFQAAKKVKALHIKIGRSFTSKIVSSLNRSENIQIFQHDRIRVDIENNGLINFSDSTSQNAEGWIVTIEQLQKKSLETLISQQHRIFDR